MFVILLGLYTYLPFGFFYLLGSNYPTATDQSILSNGYNIDQSLCSGFDEQGYARGLSASFVHHLD